MLLPSSSDALNCKVLYATCLLLASLYSTASSKPVPCRSLYFTAAALQIFRVQHQRSGSSSASSRSGSGNRSMAAMPESWSSCSPDTCAPERISASPPASLTPSTSAANAFLCIQHHMLSSVWCYVWGRCWLLARYRKSWKDEATGLVFDRHLYSPHTGSDDKSYLGHVIDPEEGVADQQGLYGAQLMRRSDMAGPIEGSC